MIGSIGWPDLEELFLTSNAAVRNGCPPDPNPLTDAAADALVEAMSSKMPALKVLMHCNNKMTSAGKQKLEAEVDQRSIYLDV